MKNNINNYESLLISLASKGDCTAFHSLVVSHLTKQYCKLLGGGETHSEASAKLCSIGADLFKKFIGASPENFFAWLKGHSEIDENFEGEFLPSNGTQSDCKQFSNELHLCLQRFACALHVKTKKGYGFQILSRNKRGLFLVTTLVLITILISSMFFLKYSLKLQLVNTKKEFSLNIPKFSFESMDINALKKIDTVFITKVIQSAPKEIDLSDSIAKAKEHLAQVKRAAAIARSITRSPDIQTTVSPRSSVSGISTQPSGAVNPASSNTTGSIQPTQSNQNDSIWRNR
jgi:hypothetical protein